MQWRSEVSLSCVWIGLLSVILLPSCQGRTWAVVVSTSRYWLNYRHQANALAMYRILRAHNVPDSRIILMLADDAACNARNPYSGHVFLDVEHETDLYSGPVEVDFTGNEVTLDAFLHVLAGRATETVPTWKILQSTAQDNVLVYLTGHGGEEFLKFRDTEVLTARHLQVAVEDMYRNQRYHRLTLVVDTCKAGTLANLLPQNAAHVDVGSRAWKSGSLVPLNVITLGSSRSEENSYAYEFDPEIGIALMDRFTYSTYLYLARAMEMHKTAVRSQRSGSRLVDLLEFYNPTFLQSQIDQRTFQSDEALGSIYTADVFGDSVYAELRVSKVLNSRGSGSEMFPSEPEDFDSNVWRVLEEQGVGRAEHSETLGPSSWDGYWSFAIIAIAFTVMWDSFTWIRMESHN